MEGSPYRKCSFSQRKGVVPTGPEVLPSRDPGRLLAGTQRSVSCLGSGGIQYLRSKSTKVREHIKIPAYPDVESSKVWRLGTTPGRSTPAPPKSDSGFLQKQHAT
ncbi:hypothetical protein F2Q69_00059614 [Brassica cretica]|uniref:Uncharacterized protein n=1 Tax=Brassica cretica TaxID=69181 RepID=A0A8S9RQ80_BRACR|nr:hypothetical protein F2Q69_00059614 [Brassica cretica]